MKRLLLSLALAFLGSEAWAQCTLKSSCTTTAPCDFNAAGSWDAGAGCVVPPSTATETWIIGSGLAAEITAAVTTGEGDINGGRLTFSEAATLNGDGFVVLTQQCRSGGSDILRVRNGGVFKMRASNYISVDSSLAATSAGCEFSADETSWFDFRGTLHDTTLTAVTAVAIAPASPEATACGTDTGMHWTFTVATGAEFLKAKRRVRFLDGDLRPRQFEIVSVSGNTFVACSNLADGTSGGQNLTHHTAFNYMPIGTIGGTVLRENVPDFEPNVTCTGANAPFDCCTGAGTGTCDVATIAPAVGDRLRIIDDWWIVDSSTNGYHFGSEMVTVANCLGSGNPSSCCTGAGAGSCTGSTGIPSVFVGGNMKGIGERTHNGIYFYAATDATDGTDFHDNNLHDYIGNDIVKFRGFKNFDLYGNAIHDAADPASQLDTSDAAIWITSGDDPGNGAVDSDASNIRIYDNDIYGGEGTGIAVGEAGTVTMVSQNVIVEKNLIRDGCRESALTNASCNGIRLVECYNCAARYNQIHDMCEVSTGNVIDQANAGIEVSGAATGTTDPSGIGIANTLSGTVVHDNWIANICGRGIRGTVASGGNTTQKVGVTHNYVSHVQNDGIVNGFRAYSNVVNHYGMLNTATGTGIHNAIEGHGNFVLGADALLDTSCDCAIYGMQYRNVSTTGLSNQHAVALSDNVVIYTDRAATPYGVYLNATCDFNVTGSHMTFDGRGKAMRSVNMATTGNSTVTYAFADLAVTHTNGTQAVYCTTEANVTDTIGAFAANQSLTATADVLTTMSNCSTAGTATADTELFLDRDQLDFSLSPGSSLLTAGSSSSALGSRAFRFNRARMAAPWGGVLAWRVPFPADFSNGSCSGLTTCNQDSDGDGVMDLHDNCDSSWNASQYDGDADGTGCACDSSGDTCP